MTKAPPNSFHPQSRDEWRRWLEQNQGRDEGVWLISDKKATGKARFDYGAAVEEALCFGWIDSKPNKLDRERSMLWFAPRKPRTGWSRPNKLRVEEMIRTGRMAAAGKPATRAARIEETSRLAARNLRANQWRPAAKKQDTGAPT